jgi:Prokaryotic cytochrome b561
MTQRPVVGNSKKSPYQPLLLRLLHGLNALLVMSAIVTGFWIYNTFDHRWIRFPLPRINSILDIHGAIGTIFLVVTLLFTVYSVAIGHRRLIQQDSLAKLAEVDKPIWWYTIHRFTNTAMLVAALFALITGQLMQGSWLPSGELTHIEYSLHLAAWATMIAALMLHLAMSVKVGGIPLLLSIVNFKYRSGDSPKLWLQKIRDRRE